VELTGIDIGKRPGRTVWSHSRLSVRDAKMSAKADVRFALADDLETDGDLIAAYRQRRIGWRLCRKAWKARAKDQRKRDLRKPVRR
jgi:hypothetical protein